MTDDAFLSAILAAPSDDTARLVYADWLEEQGDPRAPILRLEVALASPNLTEAERGNLQTQLREACVSIDPAWLAAMNRMPIENCNVSFRFRCPKKWEQLAQTTDETVRFCNSCRKQVFFCSNIEVAQTHAAIGECIAIDLRLTRKPDDLESNIFSLDFLTLGTIENEVAQDPKSEEP